MPLQYMERQIHGLVQMPIAVSVRDGDGLRNKELQFSAYSTVLAFSAREDAEQVAEGLARALSVSVEYTEINPPDEEVVNT